MKRFVVALLFSSLFFNARSQDSRTAPLTAIVQQISDSWKEAENEKDSIKLESVSATFTLSKTSIIGGQLKIWIFKLGTKVEKKKMNSITLDLAKGDNKSRPESVTRRPDELKAFIRAAIEDFRKLDSANLLPALTKRTLTLEIGLTISKENSGGLEYEIGIFSLSAEGGRNSEQGHTLKMVFTKENAQKKAEENKPTESTN